jgi:predicted DNA-binding protein (UPF0251 family)
MPSDWPTAGNAETFAQLRDVRDRALEHVRQAQRLAMERREIMRGLITAGVSQAEIARELGVSRQAVQKMLTLR